MTFTEIMNLFTLYGVDVVLLGILTCVLTQVLKTTILKNAPHKIYTVLPLAIGTLLYVVYAALTNMSLDFLCKNFGEVCERGFSVSAVATIIYNVYEQFIRKNGNVEEDNTSENAE